VNPQNKWRYRLNRQAAKPAAFTKGANNWDWPARRVGARQNRNAPETANLREPGFWQAARTLRGFDTAPARWQNDSETGAQCLHLY
jgi:hypothetical protein